MKEPMYIVYGPSYIFSSKRKCIHTIILQKHKQIHGAFFWFHTIPLSTQCRSKWNHLTVAHVSVEVMQII